MKSEKEETAALLTRTSTRPSRRSASAAAKEISSGFPESARMATALREQEVVRDTLLSIRKRLPDYDKLVFAKDDLFGEKEEG